MVTIKDAATSLGVSVETVEAWIAEFPEYLSRATPGAPSQERQLSPNDLQVLALISCYWEEEPDIPHIQAMLNSGDQNENRYLEFSQMAGPIFQEVPSQIDESWRHGAVIGGMAGRDLPQIARAYKVAADELLKQALANRYEPHELDYPIFFMYRHCLELYIKAILWLLGRRPPKTHELEKLTRTLEEHLGKKISPWISKRLREFDLIDKKSDLFRYDELIANGELWVDFNQLKMVMDHLVAAFEEYLQELTSF